MSKFRKKPVVIEAVRLTYAEWDNGAWAGDPFSEEPSWLTGLELAVEGGEYRGWYIGTLEGKMLAAPGDWIIKGVKGELYPCKPDIFEATYEPVT